MPPLTHMTDPNRMQEAPRTPDPGIEMSAILEQLVEGVIVADAEGRITFVNESARQMHGVAELGVEVENYSDTYHLQRMDGSPYPPHELPLARCVLHGDTVVEELWRIHRPDGTEVIAIGSARPVLAPDGVQRASVLTVRDVTVQQTLQRARERADEERHRTELALRESLERTRQVIETTRATEERRRESETRFRMLVAQSPLSIQILDPKGRTVQVNRAWEQLWGLTLADLHDYNMLQDPQLEEKGILAYIRRAFAGEAVEIPSVLYDPEQTLPDRTTRRDPPRWTRAHMYPVKNESGDIREVVLIHEDITERVVAQDAVRRSEVRYRRIVETAHEGIWSIDSEAITSFVNRRMADMLGYTVEEMLGRSLYTFLDGEELANLTERIARRRSGLSEQYDARYKRKDGSDVWIIVNATPIVDAEGNFEGSLAMMTDISDRKRTEKAVLEYQAEIESLNRRLQRSIQETHHRVKNNLQMISALVEVQAAGDAETVPAAAMQRIGQHTLSLAAIHDLLTQQVKADPHADTISTRAVMDRLIPLLQATIGTRQIQYRVEEIYLPVQAGTSLTLLTAEIISNAVKHGRGNIEVALTAENDSACLEVCDDGLGFPRGFVWNEAANTGMSLIDMAGRHELRGSVSYANRPEGGARVVVKFPLSSHLSDR